MGAVPPGRHVVGVHLGRFHDGGPQSIAAGDQDTAVGQQPVACVGDCRQMLLEEWQRAAHVRHDNRDALRKNRVGRSGLQEVNPIGEPACRCDGPADLYRVLGLDRIDVSRAEAGGEKRERADPAPMSATMLLECTVCRSALA